MNNFNECGFGGGKDRLWIILLQVGCGGSQNPGGVGRRPHITVPLSDSCCGCGGCNDCGCK